MRYLVAMFVVMALASPALAQTRAGQITGTVKDTTGGALPGVLVQLTKSGSATAFTNTDRTGRYQFDMVQPGRYDVSYTLINFAPLTRKNIAATAGQSLTMDVVLQLTLSADVMVTGERTFMNLADVADPAASLVGVAGAASEGAITAQQIGQRPIMRAGEVLETVPGLIISQHSGEGKANQYYLRGFNLDHGTDFATTVAGIPVNMPTHGHGHGYTDANFLIPELVSGVQFKKGPYYAEEGDFSAAGAVNVNYLNALDRPLLEVADGGEGWQRFLVAGSPAVGKGHLLGALELNHNDGPWTRPDDFRKVNGVIRYSQGDAASAFSVTGIAYHGTWNSSDQVPDRAIASGDISRFGNIDATDGGETHRYSASADAQWLSSNSATRANGYFVDYALNLFSNFTYFLDDPVHGDQFEQVDRRKVTGGRVTHRRLKRWVNRAVENLFGAQIRHDAIGAVALYHTEARTRLSTVREDQVGQSSVGLYAQSAVQWSSVVRTVVGVREDVFHFNVTSDDPANSGVRTEHIASPKFTAVFGPWNGTEFYANAGLGFHSNDGRSATLTRDPNTGDPVDSSTPLVRERGAEAGLRTVRIPHMQTTLALWGLGLDSELVFAGDAGTTEPSRPSRRMGVEWATYSSPLRWLSLDADVSVSRAKFTDADPVGDQIPGSVQSVVSLGAAVSGVTHAFGSVRLRYFGPRPLIEDNSVQSKGTSLVNGQLGYRFSPHASLVLDLFNVFDTDAADIDYFYRSRLPGEPVEGVEDIHTHPTLPRSARVSLHVGF